MKSSPPVVQAPLNRARLSYLLAFMLVVLLAAAFAPAANASLPTAFSITPITNDVVGLNTFSPAGTDSPNTFPVAARVCNNSSQTINGITAELHWVDATGTGATNINVSGPDSIGLNELKPGVCNDAYFTVEITRDEASFDATREYYFEVRGSGYTSGLSVGRHRIAVERLSPQSKTATLQLTGPGGCDLDRIACDPPQSDLVVGNTYTYRLYGATTEALENFQASVNFPGSIFRVLRTTTTASNGNTAAANLSPSPFDNACELEFDYFSPSYKQCLSSATVDGNFDATYTVKVIGAGSGTLKSQVYGGSGSSWHMNADYGNAAASADFSAKWPVNVSISGYGTVNSAPAGIDCGINATSCQGTFVEGTSVTLTAAAGADSAFIGWGGACAGNAATCTVDATAVRDVTAFFDGTTFAPLHVSVNGLGSVTSMDEGILGCTATAGSCTKSYFGEQLIGLVASPFVEQAFAGWSGGGCAGLSSICIVSMDQAQKVHALFTPTAASSYGLTTGTVGDGLVTSETDAINCGEHCTTNVSEGQTVALLAEARPGSIFSGWSGSCEGSDATCNVTMDQVRDATATFVPSANLTVAIEGEGGGLVQSDPWGINCGSACSEDFAASSTVTLTAYTYEGSEFTGWSGACSGLETTCVVTMNSATNVSANYALLDPPVNTTAPTISGHRIEGWTLTAHEGEWTGAPTIEFAYQWYVCDELAENCFQFDGETNSTFVPPAWMVGSTLAVGVTATNADGASTVFTATTEPIAPSTATAPEIQGTAMEGQWLETSNGTWTLPNEDLTFTYQWQHCDADNVYDCSDIEGSTDRTIFLVPSDLNWKIQVVVTAHSDDGSASQTSWFAGPVGARAPENWTPPTVVGDLAIGSTVTADTGEWSGTPVIEFEYTWYRCESDGGGCQWIEEAVGSTYEITEQDVGHTLMFGLAGSNQGGTTGVFSEVSGVIGTSAPESIFYPEITGDTLVGSTLTTTDGEWDGIGPITYTYQWRRCDAAAITCVDIDGETNQTYNITNADEQSRLTVTVTAHNAGGAHGVTVDPPIGPVVDPSRPVVTGQAIQTATLSTSNGLWPGMYEPYLTYTYQWQSCDANGNQCDDIVGAVNNSLVLTPNEVGRTIRVVVDADENGEGHQSQTSLATGVVAGINTIPVISGDTIDGETLTTSNGTWALPGDLTFEYVWNRCDLDGDNCIQIEDSSSAQYELTAQDIGHTLRAVVFASNGEETSNQQTDPSAVVVSGNRPAITGTLRDGETLTSTEGLWPGMFLPLDYSYQWIRCDADRSNCVEIEGATASEYLLTADDVSHRIRVAVTATNGEQTETQNSGQTKLIAAAVGPPVISGSTVDGQTLTTTNGEWGSYGQFLYFYQWKRCDIDGENCAVIDGATTNELLLTPEDVGSTIRVEVNADNGEDSMFQTSNPTAVVAARAPVNGERPVTEGVARQGQPITTTTGIWDGTPEITYTYQWYRCGEVCDPINGETAASFTPTANEVGYILVALVTGTNAGGSSTVPTAPTDAVLPGAPNQEGNPEVSGDPIEGATLTTTNGDWVSDSEITFTYQWMRCDENGDNCEAIQGGTDQDYVAGSGDVGFMVTAVVTATNAGGSNSAQASPPIGLIGGTPAAVTVAASDLTATSVLLNGTIDSRYADTDYLFQWGTAPDDLGNNSGGIVDGLETGATPVSALLTELAPSTTYYFRLSAQSGPGDSMGDVLSFTTAALPVDLPATPDPAPTPPARFSVAVATSSQSMERATFAFDLPGAGSGTFTGKVQDDKRHVGAESNGKGSSGKTFTAFSRTFSENEGGRFALPATLSEKALDMLRDRGFLRVSMTAKFTPAGGGAVQTYRQVVKLRPFAISSFAAVESSNSVSATLRTPRTGELEVAFLLRNRETGSSTTIRAFRSRERPGGTYKYTAPLSAADRAAIGSGRMRLMVKAELDTKNHPSRMLRSRYTSCDFCS